MKVMIGIFLLAFIIGNFILLSSAANATDETDIEYRVYNDSGLMEFRLDDRSDSANDWHLVNNPNAFFRIAWSINNGGYHSPFFIETGSPTNLLYLESNGRIGINTDVPKVDLDIRSGEPAIRLDDTSLFAGRVDLVMDTYLFKFKGFSDNDIVQIDTRAPSSTFSINLNGHAGFGTQIPMANLHLEGGNDDATFLFENDGNGWYMLNKNASGRFNITDDPTFARVPFKIGMSAQQNLLKVGCGVTDQVYINGNLVVAGTITPDYVFEDRYPLRSIEDHADFMWKEKHLPAVEKAKVDEEGKGVVNLGKRSQELLEELETAHIYIQQLNQKTKALESLNSMMREDFENKIEELATRLAKIES